MKSEVIVEEDATHLARRAARVFTRVAIDSVSLRGRFVVALSGGFTPRATHKMLAQKPRLSDIPWGKTYIFWVDERCVPEDDSASNYGVAKQDFLDSAPIPTNHVHPMPGWARPEEGASLYEAELKAFFQASGGYPVFDLVFLGVGTDGHTASLFPNQEDMGESRKWVVAVRGGDPDVFRLTLTYGVLNRAKQIYFLVSGEGKAAILKTVFEDQQGQLPAQKIQPAEGTLTWLLDKKAAALLNWGDRT